MALCYSLNVLFNYHAPYEVGQATCQFAMRVLVVARKRHGVGGINETPSLHGCHRDMVH